MATKPRQKRISMKLLWQLREDYCFASHKRTAAEMNALEETRRFINFVAQSLKSPNTNA